MTDYDAIKLSREKLATSKQNNITPLGPQSAIVLSNAAKVSKLSKRK